MIDVVKCPPCQCASQSWHCNDVTAPDPYLTFHTWTHRWGPCFLVIIVVRTVLTCQLISLSEQTLTGADRMVVTSSPVTTGALVSPVSPVITQQPVHTAPSPCTLRVSSYSIVNADIHCKQETNL